MTSAIKNASKKKVQGPKKVAVSEAPEASHRVGDPAAAAPASLEGRAHAAEALLRKAESLVVTERALTPTEKRRAHGLLRVPQEAIAIAIDVAERHPTRFPDFDVGAAKRALAVIAANAPLAQQCRDMAARIEENTLGVQSAAAEQALVVYGSMKALTRLAKGESMLPQLRQMAALLRTRVKKRAPKEGAAAPPAKTTEPPAIDVVPPKPGASAPS